MSIKFRDKMNQLTVTNNKTMSSLQIAELVEIRPDSVKRSIKRLMSGGTISQSPLVGGIKAANGVVERLYYVSERDSYVIVAQLSPAFTGRLVDRWRELETANLAVATPAPISITTQVKTKTFDENLQELMVIKLANMPLITASFMVEACSKRLRAMGMRATRAAYLASKVVFKQTGINFLDTKEFVKAAEELIVEEAIDTKNVRYFTPTQLGEEFSVSGYRMNLKLKAAGLQTLVATNKALGYYRFVDVPTEGGVKQQLKWCMAVLDLLDVKK